MHLHELQKLCETLLLKVRYPRIATIIGLQEEVGKLSGVVMDLEVYEKPYDKKRLEQRCSELFFSFIDLCNSYGINLDKVSNNRLMDVKYKIAKWEKEHGSILQKKKKKYD
jgi:hypothetical protein